MVKDNVGKETERDAWTKQRRGWLKIRTETKEERGGGALRVLTTGISHCPSVVQVSGIFQQHRWVCFHSWDAVAESLGAIL
jgi:hypothetical protein